MSFFDKIKKGIGVEEEEEIKEKKPAAGRTKKIPALRQGGPAQNPKKLIPKKEGWPESEGQLAIDVYQTPEEIVIQSTIAGVKAEDLDVSFENDMVIIEGKREKFEEVQERNYFYQECYWGAFSRKILLPEEVDTSQATATMEKGILTIRVPRARKRKRKKIAIKEE